MTDETIFAAALERPTPAERAAFLDEACAGDADLRRRIEALLAAHDKASGFMERPVVPPGATQGATRSHWAVGVEGGGGRTQSHGGPDDDTDDALGFLAPSARADSLGRIGHYEVLEVLGRGGFGVVFRAFDDVLQRVVAVKVLAPSLAATSPARKRFLREARSAGQLRHENVVLIHETGEHPLPYLVMEFVPGETLQHRLDRTGPLDIPEILRIGRQVAEGLAAAHANDLIHRDIKPSNILIEGGPQQRVKITDFGLARAADDASISQSGIVAGTPMYMAPEQAKGEALDNRADLFSLGSVLYVMCSGRPPFRANSTLAVLKRVAEEQPRPIREIIPEVPEWLCRIVEKLHAKDPADRYQSAREVADVLADCERQLQSHRELRDYSRIPGGEPAAPRWTLPRPVVVAAAALLPVTVAILFLLDEGGSVRTIPLSALVGVLVSVVAVGASQYLGRPDAATTPAARWLSRMPVWAVLVCAAAGTLAAAFVFHLRDLDDVGRFLVAPPLVAALFSALFSLIPARPPAGRGAVAASRPRRARPVARRPRSGAMLAVMLVVGTLALGVVGLAVAAAAFWILIPIQDDVRQNPAPSVSGGESVGPVVSDANGRELAGWGTVVDPKRDCRFEADADGLVITIPGGHHNLNPAPPWNDVGAPRVLQKAETDFLLEVRVEPFQMPDRGTASVGPVSYFGAGLLLWQDDRTFVRFLRATNGETRRVFTTIEYFRDGRMQGSRLLDIPDLPTFLRVTRRGQDLRFWFSTDGSQFTEMPLKSPARLSDQLDVGVAATNSTVKPFAPRFRGFLFRPGGDSAGFVPLFNGRDLTGWKTNSNEPGSWHVVGGVLVGTGNERYLFSERGDYRDFHLRVEAKITDKGNSGVHFRSVFGPRLPDGYEAQINLGTDPWETGSLLVLPWKQDASILNHVKERLIEPDKWFTLEVLAQGPRIIIKVDGKVVTDLVDHRYQAGHLALQAGRLKTEIVQFRRIEIKELPPGPSPADPAVVQALRDAIIAKQKSRDAVKTRFDVGVSSKADLIAAEIDLIEVRVRLAEAEQKVSDVVKLLEELVQHRQEERRLIELRVKAGVAAADELNQADARLADAKARLAKARSEQLPAPARDVAPPPRPKR